MEGKAEQKRMLTRYLMREMSEQERSEFEDRYIDDPGLFEELIAAEDEMMRSYVRGDGTQAERVAFEKHFLRNRGGRQRVEFARSLVDYVSTAHDPASGLGAADQGVEMPRLAPTERQKPRPRKWQWASRFLTAAPKPAQIVAAAVIVLLIAGGFWLALMDSRLRRGFEQMQVQHASDLHGEQELRSQLADLNLRLQQQEEQVAQLSSLGATILPFTLTSHLIRQNHPQRPLVIPTGFPAVFLEPALSSNGYPNYSASLETPEGRQIWRQSGLKSWPIRGGSHVVGLILPARIFESRNYILRLNGRTATGKSEEVDSYAFRVVRK
jgi:hypothetical protein